MFKMKLTEGSGVKNFQWHMDRLSKKGLLTEALKDAGEVVSNSVVNYVRRLTKGGEGQSLGNFKPLKPYTIKRRKNKNTKQLLYDTGAMVDSNINVGKASVYVNVVNIPISIKDRKVKVLTIHDGGRGSDTGGPVPARPFLSLSANLTISDLNSGKGTSSEALKNVFNRILKQSKK